MLENDKIIIFKIKYEITRLIQLLLSFKNDKL